MGLAIIWIILNHVEYNVSNPVMSYIKLIGYGGVDIFVFASGVGCYRSLSKNDDVLSFYGRRIKRVCPTYWLFLPLWFVFKLAFGELAESSIIGNILMVQSFTGLGNDVNWFISGILLFYLIAPLLYALMNRFDSKRGKLFTAVGLFVLSAAFWNSLHMNIIITRLIVFYLGMWYCNLCDADVSITKPVALWSVISVVIGNFILWACIESIPQFLRTIGLWWYPFILIAPGLCILISLIADWLTKNRFGNRITSLLALCGDYSFELFLGHFVLFEALKKLIDLGYIANAWYVWIGTTLIAIPIAVIMRKLSEFILKKINKKTGDVDVC